jgi:hypothetical protein
MAGKHLQKSHLQQVQLCKYAVFVCMLLFKQNQSNSDYKPWMPYSKQSMSRTSISYEKLSLSVMINFIWLAKIENPQALQFHIKHLLAIEGRQRLLAWKACLRNKNSLFLLLSGHFFFDFFLIISFLIILSFFDWVSFAWFLPHASTNFLENASTSPPQCNCFQCVVEAEPHGTPNMLQLQMWDFDSTLVLVLQICIEFKLQTNQANQKHHGTHTHRKTSNIMNPYFLTPNTMAHTKRLRLKAGGNGLGPLLVATTINIVPTHLSNSNFKL